MLIEVNSFTQLKIDFKLDTASRNYDAFKGDMLARVADGNRASTSHDRNEHPTFSSGRMDKTTYISSVAAESPRYAVGMMEARGLFLVPVKSKLTISLNFLLLLMPSFGSLAFFQMRQSYSYFDKGDKRTKSEKGELQDEEQDEDLKQVTVKFARSGDSEKIKKAREKSYWFISQIGQDEAWCETLIYPKNTAQSQLERLKISNINIYSDISSGTNMTSSEYFAKLMSVNAYSLTTTGATVKPEDTSQILSKGPISKRQIKKLPLLDQLKVIIKDAKVLSFNQILEFLDNPELTAEKVLQNLKLCGVMISGNWTLQSEILYHEGYVSSVNGISSELMCRGRDYVLYKLARNELMTLNRQKISSIIQLPHEETREILESVACLKSDKTWDLLRTPDYEFVKKYTDVQQRQETIWKAQEEKFLEMEAEKIEKRKRTRSVRESKA